MKILITGASGFIGAYFCKKLHSDNKVVALVKNKGAYSGLDYYELRNKVDIVEGDLSTLSVAGNSLSCQLVRYDFDIVLHFAAQTIVRKSQENPIETFYSNIMGTANLLNYFKQIENSKSAHRLKLFVNMSTDKVYGNMENSMENDPYQVTCPYSASKIAVEQICKTYINVYDFPILIVRPCNIYGEGDFNNRVIPNVIESILNRKEAVLFEGDSNMFRQYVYIEDLYRAIMFLVSKNQDKKVVNNLVFNIAPFKKEYNADGDLKGIPGVSSTEKIVKSLIDISGYEVKLLKKPVKSIVEIPAQSVNANKLVSIGYKANFSLKEGLERTFLWYKNNPGFFSAIRKR